MGENTPEAKSHKERAQCVAIGTEILHCENGEKLSNRI